MFPGRKPLAVRLTMAALLAMVLTGCSPFDSDAGAARREKEKYEQGLRESVEEERSERPSDVVPSPVLGRPAAAPLRVDPVPGVNLTLSQCVEYMLPNWETRVVLAHRQDPDLLLDRPMQVKFRGGSLEQFLEALSETWDVDVSSPHVGLVQIASRRLEPWLVTHWMQPPTASGESAAIQRGPAQGGSSQDGTSGNQQSRQQQRGSAGGGLASTGSVTANLAAQPGEGLSILIRRLRELAGENDGDGESSVWLNAESGLLYIWARPSMRRAMRPLLIQYGARPLASDPELLTMMTRGQFRLRLVLVRIASSNNRNVGLQWEEGLHTIFPTGRSVMGVPEVGYGGPAREDRLVGTGNVLLGANGLQIGGTAAYDRDAVTFPFGSRWELATEQSRQASLQRVIELERQRTQADLSRVERRITELEADRAASRADNSSVSFGATQESELSALRLERGKIVDAIADLAREIGLAALRSTQAQEWLDRVNEGAERDLTRSLSLLASLGSAHGQTQVAQTISIDARHGRPLPLRIGSERTYLASISETVSESFSTTAANPETRLEGLDLVMRPWLEGRQCVRVGLALTNSGITSVASFSVSGTELSIPQMAVQTWVSERRLCDTRPALLGRFKLESSIRTRSGLPLFGARQVPLSSDQQGASEEYLLLLQVLLPPEWGWR